MWNIDIMIGLQLYWGSLESDIVESKIATAILDLPWQTEFCVYKYIIDRPTYYIWSKHS